MIKYYYQGGLLLWQEKGNDSQGTNDRWKESSYPPASSGV